MPSSMIPRHFHLSHRSIKTRFAYRFLRALKKLNKPIIRNTCIHTTNTTRSRRYRMVKTAAYASMAAAVGTKRAWSRALLRKIRNRGRTTIHHHVVATKRSKLGARGGSVILSKKTISMKENPSNKATGQLQKLVPGGEVMDFCSLLDETAHYIKCLTSQVEIDLMKNQGSPRNLVS